MLKKISDLPMSEQQLNTEDFYTIRIEERIKMSEEVRNAIIESVSLTTDDRGCLSMWLTLNYGGLHQGFGGFALYLPKSFKHHKLESVAGHFIFRCMQIADVSDFNKLVGKSVRAKCDCSRVFSIGHIIKDDWFNPTEDFKKMGE